MKIAAVPMAGCLFTLMSPCFGASLSSLLDQPAPTRVVTYKTVGDTALQMALFSPAERPPAKGRAAVVWIHGGAWTSGTKEAFYPHARYFQTRGCVGISIDYRLMRPQGGTALDSFADCKSAMRYLRAHAESLGIDPDRIAVAGDSAGGHLAGCLATLSGFDDPQDDLAVSAVPDAAILYNPITDLTDGPWWYAVDHAPAKGEKVSAPSADVLKRARALSPMFHIPHPCPPMLVMHGLNDHIVSPDQSRRIAKAMQAAGNACELQLVEGAKHAFVCTRYTAPLPMVVSAIRAADTFLVARGILSGAPTLGE